MFELFLPLVELFAYCAVIAIVVIAVLYPVSKTKRTTFAVMKRNFVSYFSNPTGYVFICVFMLLSSIAAFWPEEFFNRNLATLSQLNRWFPMIMLVFIPAITMSIWSEERREGTDELLLTIPASDVDVVLGKYLAAVAIFSVALFFSMFTNFMVLLSLAIGDIDVGLFMATYAGYWFIGLAMLAVGMAASFLTSNLTVGFILGALFNAPLVFLTFSELIVPRQGVSLFGREISFLQPQNLASWSYAARFADFGRGVLSLSSIVFFLLVSAVGVYVSIILIGRRHWLGGRDGQSMLGHYLVRAFALVTLAVGLTWFFSDHDWIRHDMTSGKTSSLASDTKKLLRNLDPKHGVLVEAFVSRSVPQEYVQTKVDLMNMLRELEALSGSKVQVRLHRNLEPFTEEATRAEEQYEIMPRKLTLQRQSGIRQEEIFLGAAVTSGLERVIIPFFERGIPVEYELVRSITTVAEGNRKKIGVVKTDAEMFGGMDMQRFSRRPPELIIEELKKQYEVEEVIASEPIPEDVYDVLLVVQPSSLPAPQLDNLIASIRNGQPTAVFEDPFPYALANAPGTSEPRRPQGGGMFGMGGQPPEPKGDIRRLWDVLGIDMVGKQGDGFSQPFNADVVWQAYNPYASLVDHEAITPEWVFVSPDAPGSDNEALNDEVNVTSGLRQLLFFCPGGIRNLGARDLTFTPLAKTGDVTGVINYMDLRQNQRDPMALQYLRQATEKRYIVAARIKGFLKDDLTMSHAGSPLLAQATVAPAAPATDSPAAAADEPKDAASGSSEVTPSDAEKSDAKDRAPEIHVVYVGDIDLLSSEFLMLRAQPDAQFPWDFDNVPFVLNILDSLANDESLVGIRKRKTRHSTLKMVEMQTDAARKDALKEIEKFEEEYQQEVTEAKNRLEAGQREAQQRIEELQQKAQSEGRSQSQELVAEITRWEIMKERSGRQLKTETERLKQERDRKLKKIDNELEQAVRAEQTQYKLNAAFLPLLPPFVVGLVVWYFRTRREQESVGGTRVR